MSVQIKAFLPAAGFGKRLGKIPCSKEILPIIVDRGKTVTPIDFPLKAVELTSVTQVLIAIRKEKLDIVSWISQQNYTLNIYYKVVEPTNSMPETLLKTIDFFYDSWVLLLFPDIAFAPQIAVEKFIKRVSFCKENIYLALFPPISPDKVDMVEIDNGSRVKSIEIKPKSTNLKYTWGFALVPPRFLKEFPTLYQQKTKVTEKEIHIGELFMQSSIPVEGAVVSQTPIYDLGIPENCLSFQKSEFMINL